MIVGSKQRRRAVWLPIWLVLLLPVIGKPGHMSLTPLYYHGRMQTRYGYNIFLTLDFIHRIRRLLWNGVSAWICHCICRHEH
jgi:hypothetical protein